MAKRSDLSLAAPKNEGVERISGVSGRVTRCKPPGAFAAATYGRLTGKPAVCISALGPGVLNFCFISKIPC